MSHAKKSATVMVRMPPEMQANLRTIADFKGWESPELIRRALRGIIETFRETGTLPDYMRIVAADVERPQLLAAEPDQGDYPPARYKPPDKTSRSRGAGPDHRVSKSA